MLPTACNLKQACLKAKYLNVLPVPNVQEGIFERGPGQLLQDYRMFCCVFKPTINPPIETFKDFIASTDHVGPEQLNDYQGVRMATVIELPNRSPSVRAAAILQTMSRTLQRR